MHNPKWSTNHDELLKDMKPKLHELGESYSELLWLSKREEVRQEIQEYLPQLDDFILNQPGKPSQIVGRLFDPQDWHDEHDFDLIFRAWAKLQPLVEKAEDGWLRYLPREGSVGTCNAIKGGAIRCPGGLVKAMQEGRWLKYKGDLYKAEWSHFLDTEGYSDDARKVCIDGLAILKRLNKAVRKDDSRYIILLLFGAEKKLLVESEAFIKDEEDPSKLC